MANQLSLEETLIPLHTFPVQDVFVWRHEQGTLIEMSNETEMLKRFNESRNPLTAWPIAPIPGLKTSFITPWLLLVKIPSQASNVLFPNLTDRFHIDMDGVVENSDGKFSLVHLPATRIANPYAQVDAMEGLAAQSYAAFKVDVPRSWQNTDGDSTELDLMANFQVAASIHEISETDLTAKNQHGIFLKWDTSSTTFDSELAALRYLTEQKSNAERGPSPRSLTAFHTILDFNNVWKDFYNLHDFIPHLRDPENPSHRVPKNLVDKYKEFDADHRAAFNGLTAIPNGLYFVNGCPGAGKTEWNLVMSGLIQSKPRPHSKKKCSPILFLVDLNETVDDAANRYFSLCKESGLNLRIIRMHGWPSEMRQSVTLNKTSTEGDKDEAIDFTKRFLTTSSVAKYSGFESSANHAPTLDAAAWEYYARHRDDCFVSLKAILERLEKVEVLDTSDWKALRGLVSLLYKAVLAQTDFIATTPVAACRGLSRFFKPDIVFIDEAPHARELTTLIPIAYFDPLAWIFTGDVKQSRPFVKSGYKTQALRDRLAWNPFAEQLRISTMARAAKVGALNSKLLVNKRAHANLHNLASKMFYEGQMSSAYEFAARYPPSTLYLKGYLERLGNSPHVNENRVVVQLATSAECPNGSSFWNPAHHAWLMGRVKELLQDENFRSVTNNATPGTIMIQTPYSTAMRQYSIELKEWPQEWQDRVKAVTVDRAQGNQADIVFLDMVRTTKAGFMDDAQRLNVAITRARQAEIIVMHHNMTLCYRRGKPYKTMFLSQVWDDALLDQRLFFINDTHRMGLPACEL